MKTIDIIVLILFLQASTPLKVQTSNVISAHSTLIQKDSLKNKSTVKSIEGTQSSRKKNFDPASFATGLVIGEENGRNSRGETEEDKSQVNVFIVGSSSQNQQGPESAPATTPSPAPATTPSPSPAATPSPSPPTTPQSAPQNQQQAPATPSPSPPTTPQSTPQNQQQAPATPQSTPQNQQQAPADQNQQQP